jgi:hypothetical protein
MRSFWCKNGRTWLRNGLVKGLGGSGSGGVAVAVAVAAVAVAVDVAVDVAGLVLIMRSFWCENGRNWMGTGLVMGLGGS